jgi:hypothetical protein
VQGTYNFTRAGLHNAEQHGIAPPGVWQMLSSTKRLFWAVEGDDRSRVIIGVTDAGRYLVVIVEEDPNDEPDSWDVVAARELPEAVYEQILRRRP